MEEAIRAMEAPTPQASKQRKAKKRKKRNAEDEVILFVVGARDPIAPRRYATSHWSTNSRMKLRPRTSRGFPA